MSFLRSNQIWKKRNLDNLQKKKKVKKYFIETNRTELNSFISLMI